MARTMLKNIIWCARNAISEQSNLSIMVVHFKQTDTRVAANAFTLVEVLMAFAFLALVMSGLTYGYVQANRMAEFSSMSLSAQSYASQGAEQARAADWRPRDPTTNAFGPNTPDELTAPTNYVLSGIDYVLDVPIKGDPSTNDFAFFVTNYVSVSNINPSAGVYLREIRSLAVWRFPLTGQIYTNTVILQRGADQ
jgi:type II secretory pathway pseudopilin PulG